MPGQHRLAGGHGGRAIGAGVARPTVFAVFAAFGSAGLDEETATDVLWVFDEPAHHAALVLQRGWAEPAFRRRLANRIREALLAADRSELQRRHDSCQESCHDRPPGGSAPWTSAADR